MGQLLSTRVSNVDVRDTLTRTGNDLGVLRLINHGPGRDGWHFQVSSVEGQMRIRLVFPDKDVTPSLEVLLSGVVPEVFDCVMIEYSREGSRARVSDIDGWLNSEEFSTTLSVESLPSSSDPKNYIELIGGFPDGLPARLTDPESRNEFLSQRTWMGSYHFRSEAKRITFRILAGADVVSSKDVATVSTPPSAEIEAGEASIAVWSREGRGIEFRHATYGLVRLPGEIRDALTTVLRRRHVRGALVEFTKPAAFIQAVLGDVEPAEPLVRDFRRLQSAVVDSDALQEFAARFELARRTRAMAKLNRRVDIARSAPAVKFEGEFIGLAPRSESGAIAIFHKLEGMKALPFEYRSRAWAGAEGIDELADFQLDRLSLVETDAPVEFEFEFENFFAHEHPLEQVKLIVCWAARDVSLLRETEQTFLRQYEWDRGTIPVVLINELPGLTVDQEIS